MAIDNIYTVIDKQVFLEQSCLNVYHYRQMNAGDDQAAALTGAFVSTVLPTILGQQATLVTHLSVEAFSHEDLSDFYTDVLVSDNAGLEAGQALPPYACWSFEYLRSTRAVRNGAKRFVGVPESLQANGEAVAGELAALASLATVLGDPLVVGGVTFNPVIVHKMLTEPFTWTAYPILGVEYKGIGTQNTRKFGRGA